MGARSQASLTSSHALRRNDVGPVIWWGHSPCGTHSTRPPQEGRSEHKQIRERAQLLLPKAPSSARNQKKKAPSSFSSLLLYLCLHASCVDAPCKYETASQRVGGGRNKKVGRSAAASLRHHHHHHREGTNHHANLSRLQLPRTEEV